MVANNAPCVGEDEEVNAPEDRNKVPSPVEVKLRPVPPFITESGVEKLTVPVAVKSLTRKSPSTEALVFTSRLPDIVELATVEVAIKEGIVKSVPLKFRDGE